MPTRITLTTSQWWQAYICDSHQWLRSSTETGPVCVIILYNSKTVHENSPFAGLVSAESLKDSGSWKLRGQEESCLVRLARQSLSSCCLRSLWRVTKLRFSSVNRLNSSSRRAISSATFSSSTSSASSLRLKKIWKINLIFLVFHGLS